ncbi:hypothetical protein QBC39DRAFT_404018, partial [Podospora conica]
EPGPDETPSDILRWPAESRLQWQSCSLFSVPWHWPDHKRLGADPARPWPAPGVDKACRPVCSVTSHISARQHRQSPIAPRMFGERTYDSVGPICPFSRPTRCRQAPRSLRVGGQFGPSQFHDPALPSSGRTHGFAPSALSSLSPLRSAAAVLSRSRDPGLLLSSSHDQTCREQPRGAGQVDQCHGPSSPTRVQAEELLEATCPRGTILVAA